MRESARQDSERRILLTVQHVLRVSKNGRHDVAGERRPVIKNDLQHADKKLHLVLAPTRQAHRVQRAHTLGRRQVPHAHHAQRPHRHDCARIIFHPVTAQLNVQLGNRREVTFRTNTENSLALVPVGDHYTLGSHCLTATLSACERRHVAAIVGLARMRVVENGTLCPIQRHANQRRINQNSISHQKTPSHSRPTERQHARRGATYNTKKQIAHQ